MIRQRDLIIPYLPGRVDMQEIIKKNQPFTAVSFQFATSQRDTALQLGLSHIIAAGAALGMYFWMKQLHVQEPYMLLIVLATACVVGLLATLNLHYSLYLLELTLSHLAHERFTTNTSVSANKKALLRRWPLASLFVRLQETAQRVQQY